MSLANPPTKARLPILIHTNDDRQPAARSFQWQSVTVSLLAHLAFLAVMALLAFEPAGFFQDDLILASLGFDADDQDLLSGIVTVEDVVAEPTEPTEQPLENLLIAERHSAAVESLLQSLSPAEQTQLEDEFDGEEATTETSTPGESDGGQGNSEEAGPSGPRITDGRTGESKAALLQRFGGTRQTEASVKLGLQWLARQQMKDGSWSFSGPYPDGAFFNDNRVSATSMALLAFFGAGQTHREGEYQEQLDKALTWLVERQKKSSGAFGAGTPPHHALYTHAQATIVICEAYGMTRDRWLRQHCQQALDFCVKSQGPQGGWRYEYKGESDTSVTGWFMMALVSGKSAGFEIPPKTLLKVNAFLDSVAINYGDAYAYMPGRPATPSMTAEGLLCRMYLGWPRNNSALDRGAERLLLVAPFQVETQSYYYWYYATQVMHHLGGKHWELWNDVLREQLPAAQITVGKQAGSWPPGGRMFDAMGGRLYATCMSLYCLEVYYRHLPIYDHPWEHKPREP